MSQTVEFEMNKQLKNYIVIVKNKDENVLHALIELY